MKHLLSIDGLSYDDLSQIVFAAFGNMNPQAAVNCTRISDYECLAFHEQLSTLFMEQSTRTLGSFIRATQCMGMPVSPLLITADNSSLGKGESLTNTARMLIQQGATAIALRTKVEGLGLHLALTLGNKDTAGDCVRTDTSFIVGGAGTRDHPSQVLLDVVTIVARSFGACSIEEAYSLFQSNAINNWNHLLHQALDGLKIAFVGDMLHSRVVHDWIHLGRMFDIEFTFIAPDSLQIEDFCLSGITYKKSDTLEDAKDADYAYMIRLQIERLEATMPAHEARVMVGKFQIYENFLKVCRCEILDALPLDEQSPTIPVYLRNHSKVLMMMQSAMGVPTRMAILHFCRLGCDELVPALQVPQLRLSSKYVLKSCSFEDHWGNLQDGLLDRGDLAINPIKSGTVIDRITPGMEMLIQLINDRGGLIGSGLSVITGQGFSSTSMTSKSVIFLSNRWPAYHVAAIYGIVSPSVRLSLMRNGRYRRVELPLPEVVADVFACPNGMCVTNCDPEARTHFQVFGSKGQDVNLKCTFCRRTFSSSSVVSATMADLK